MNKQIITKRVEEFRKLMKENHLDAYIIPSGDYHGSEYVGTYFNEREFMSGFAGSNGTLLITEHQAILWTDGRYFIQAELDIADTPYVLYKQGFKEYPTLALYLAQHPELKNIGFDGKVLSTNYVLNLKKKLANDAKIIYDLDLVAKLWNDRPNLSKNPIFILEEQYAGVQAKVKLDQIKAWMNNVHQTKTYLIASLDDIAWILNLRGSDILYNPVFLSYLLFNDDKVTLYVDQTKLSKEINEYLNNINVNVKDYFAVYEDVKLLNPENKVILDFNKVNYCLYANLLSKNICHVMDYSTEAKAVKNEIEIKNAYLAHIKDGVALTKFIYWVKMNVGKIKMTEISAADYLLSLRQKNENFMDLSFETISGYDYHGAIIHYEPTKESDIEVFNKGFLLVDSGAQYKEGTTDVTRTIGLGALTDEEKYHYTLVLKSHIDLRNTIFKEGTNGATLDMIARAPLWKENLDYFHGTGHGVGSFLNVHEGPQNISVGRGAYPFKKGMITSNEPGLYFEGKHGIRIENLVLCVDKGTNEWGHFFGFDDLTLAPYEIDAINQEMLTKVESQAIHAYHERVYNTLKDYLTKEEQDWLLRICHAI